MCSEVEFKTVDGVTLRGKLYRGNEGGPGVVLCPGVRQMIYFIPTESKPAHVPGSNV